jgi:transporter family-2 protein
MLALMIGLNSQLATLVTPLHASWVAHGLGAISALLIISLIALKKPAGPQPTDLKPPFWSYLGGVPGAFVVVVAAITVNGPLGLTGTLVLSICGQVLFSLLSDQWGWFGLVKRQLTLQRLMTLVPILAGSLLIINAKGSIA